MKPVHLTVSKVLVFMSPVGFTVTGGIAIKTARVTKYDVFVYGCHD